LKPRTFVPDTTNHNLCFKESYSQPQKGSWYHESFQKPKPSEDLWEGLDDDRSICSRNHELDSWNHELYWL